MNRTLDITQVLGTIITCIAEVYNLMQHTYIKIGNEQFSLFNLSAALFCIANILVLLLSPYIGEPDDDAEL